MGTLIPYRIDNIRRQFLPTHECGGFLALEGCDFMFFNEFLELTKHTVIKTFEDIDDWFSKDENIRNYKPKNGGWSIDEVLEHITLTSFFLLKIIRKSKDKSINNPSDNNPNFYQYDYEVIERLEDIGKHKSFPWIRPEHMEPTGDKSLDDIRKEMIAQKNECLEILDLLKNGEGLERKTTMSVNEIGKIDLYQYIYFLSLHAKRHIEQMEKNEKEFLG